MAEPDTNTMKTKLVILILIATATLARANLIDLANDPTAFNRFYGGFGGFDGLQFIAAADIINGQPVWVGGLLFGSDRFSITMNPEGTGATVTWDLIGTGWRLNFVDAESLNVSPHLYGTEAGDWFKGEGSVTFFNGANPLGIEFAGRNGPVPDSGSTLVLLAVALSAVTWVAVGHKRLQQKTAPH